MRLVASLALSLAACSARSTGPTSPLTTASERSGYASTGRYAEVETLCHAFAARYEGVSCERIGETGEGRAIWMLRVTRSSGPYVYVEGGIHAGEIDGKDAGFAFVRDLLDGAVAPGALDAVNLLFVPVINPDGHERFGTNNRPNQRGPVEMGFRTNGMRLNLNRDWMKAETPEIRAVLGVYRTYDPFVSIDIHATDGAQFETDVSISLAPITPRADGLDRITERLSSGVIDRLRGLRHKPVDFYPWFADPERPHSGFERGEAPPRFGNAYMAARGRIGILVETHSWRPYKERVASAYHVLQAVMEIGRTAAPFWEKSALQIDRLAAQHGGTDVVLGWENDETTPRDIDFAGYAYERRVSELTGGTWLVYDETSPEVWRVPLLDRFVPALTLRAPYGGYIVDGGFARAVKPTLDAHGIRYQPVPAEPRAVEAFRGEASFLPPSEGRTRADIKGAWARETRTLEQGAIFIPIDQPLARLVLHLFEPTAPDSLAGWGMFNTCFAQVEYLEPYVGEAALREMLKVPALASEWEAFIARTPSPSADERIAWVHRHHPSWDERMGLLPVYRVLSRTSKKPG